MNGHGVVPTLATSPVTRQDVVGCGTVEAPGIAQPRRHCPTYLQLKSPGRLDKRSGNTDTKEKSTMSTTVADTHQTSTTATENVSNDVSIDIPGPDEIMGPSRRIRVRDGARVVAFNGQLLGYISSERPDSLRWTTLSIYRTDGGLFIAHRVGVSCVAHRVDCDSIKTKNLPSVLAMKPDEFGIEEREPCPICRPDILAESKVDPLSVRGETDRHWAGVCDNAVALLNALHTTNHGVRSLSGLASAALTQASEHDPQIAAAMNTELEV